MFVCLYSVKFTVNIDSLTKKNRFRYYWKEQETINEKANIYNEKEKPP